MDDHDIQKYKYILIDTNNLFWFSYEHKEGKVLNIGSKEINIGSIETFFHKIKYIRNKYGRQDTKLYFLFDNVQSEKSEKAIYSKIKYKSGREKKNVPIKFYKTLNLLYTLLSIYDDNFYLVDTTILNKNYEPLNNRPRQYEADDLVKLVLENIEIDYFDRCLLLSSDMDWSRSINEFVDWYNWKNFYTLEEFKNKYGFVPTEEKVKMYKSIKGDSSDSIEVGIKGFSGDSKQELLQYIVGKYKDLDELYDKLWEDDTISKEDKKTIFDCKQKVYGNYHLVDFLKLSKETFSEICIPCKININQVKLFFESMNLSLDTQFINPSNTTPKEFFNNK